MKKLSNLEIQCVSGGFSGVEIVTSAIIAGGTFAVAAARAYELHNTPYQVGAFVITIGAMAYNLYSKSL